MHSSSNILTSGLLAGIMYAMVAIGFVLIYKASGVFNFAQGSHGAVRGADLRDADRARPAVLGRFPDHLVGHGRSAPC